MKNLGTSILLVSVGVITIMLTAFDLKIFSRFRLGNLIQGKSGLLNLFNDPLKNGGSTDGKPSSVPGRNPMGPSESGLLLNKMEEIAGKISAMERKLETIEREEKGGRTVTVAGDPMPMARNPREGGRIPRPDRKLPFPFPNRVGRRPAPTGTPDDSNSVSDVLQVTVFDNKDNADKFSKSMIDGAPPSVDGLQKAMMIKVRDLKKIADVKPQTGMMGPMDDKSMNKIKDVLKNDALDTTDMLRMASAIGIPMGSRPSGNSSKAPAPVTSPVTSPTTSPSPSLSSGNRNKAGPAGSDSSRFGMASPSMIDSYEARGQPDNDSNDSHDQDRLQDVKMSDRLASATNARDSLSRVLERHDKISRRLEGSVPFPAANERSSRPAPAPERRRYADGAFRGVRPIAGNKKFGALNGPMNDFGPFYGAQVPARVNNPFIDAKPADKQVHSLFSSVDAHPEPADAPLNRPSTEAAKDTAVAREGYGYKGEQVDEKEKAKNEDKLKNLNFGLESLAQHDTAKVGTKNPTEEENRPAHDGGIAPATQTEQETEGSNGPNKTDAVKNPTEADEPAKLSDIIPASESKPSASDPLQSDRPKPTKEAEPAPTADSPAKENADWKLFEAANSFNPLNNRDLTNTANNKATLDSIGLPSKGTGPDVLDFDNLSSDSSSEGVMGLARPKAEGDSRKKRATKEPSSSQPQLKVQKDTENPTDKDLFKTEPAPSLNSITGSQAPTTLEDFM